MQCFVIREIAQSHQRQFVYRDGRNAELSSEEIICQLRPILGVTAVVICRNGFQVNGQCNWNDVRDAVIALFNSHGAVVIELHHI